MRGKAGYYPARGYHTRITPACAGKSRRSYSSCSFRQDHPRVCGEKGISEEKPVYTLGSPPRVRGKVAEIDGNMAAGGITPACAGKSECDCPLFEQPWDHPRVCGEKFLPIFLVITFPGSPPRVRGKGSASVGFFHALRITPACAGKRCVQRGRVPDWQDHPRVCGEKFAVVQLHGDAMGSPPRVRGKARLSN